MRNVFFVNKLQTPPKYKGLSYKLTYDVKKFDMVCSKIAKFGGFLKITVDNIWVMFAIQLRDNKDGQMRKIFFLYDKC